MAEMIRQGDIPGVQLRRRQDLALPPDAAWRWLVEPEKLALWLAREVEVEPGPAGELRLSGGEPLWRERGRTVELAPPHLWVLSFERLGAGWPAATRLTLRLHTAPEGSQIDVLQDGFQRLPLSIGLTVWETYRNRWKEALARLAAVAR
ncbi:MAG TPA: SRPBCC domain-containing protein [Thermoanaerobaculia bacterium]|nr:SRPBCC domain-containing protein [Thermoanaerobaculia bacterium]